MSTNKYCYCQNSPSNDTDECGSIAGTIVKMIGNFLWGMAGGMFGLYLANVTLNIANGKKNFYAKNDSWGTYIAEGVKSGAFAILGGKLVYKIIAVIGASVLKQFVDMLIYKSSFNFWGLLIDIVVGILVVIVLHFGPTVLKKGTSMHFCQNNLICIIVLHAGNYLHHRFFGVFQDSKKIYRISQIRRYVSSSKGVRKCASQQCFVMRIDLEYGDKL